MRNEPGKYPQLVSMFKIPTKVSPSRALPIPYCIPDIESFYLDFILFVSRTDLQSNTLCSFKKMSVPPYPNRKGG